MCISRATSANPAGPFVDDSSSAFVCPLAQGGAIDPSVFVAPDGTPWLLWKSDGDCCNMPTTIYSQQLSGDGLSVVGPAHRLIGATQSWEGNLVEGPSMIENAQHVLALLLGQSLGERQLRHRRGALCHGRRPLYQAARPRLALVDGIRGPERPRPRGIGVLPSRRSDLDGASRSRARAERGRRPATALRRPARLPERRDAASCPAATGGCPGRSAALLRGPQCAAPAGRCVPGAAAQGPERFSHDTDESLEADGRLACDGLTHEQGADDVVDSLTHRGLDQFEASLVGITATEYFCPQDGLQALKDVQEALTQGPS